MEKEKIYLVMHCQWHDDYAQPSYACLTKEKAEECIDYLLSHNVIVSNGQYFNANDKREYCTIEEMEIEC